MEEGKTNLGDLSDRSFGSRITALSSRKCIDDVWDICTVKSRKTQEGEHQKYTIYINRENQLAPVVK